MPATRSGSGSATLLRCSLVLAACVLSDRPHCAHAAASKSPPPWAIEGQVDDCCCSVDFVDEQNTDDGLNEQLRHIVKQPFFRIFKVALHRDCHLFPDDGKCNKESCAVGECSDHEVPEPWRKERECSVTIKPLRPASERQQPQSAESEECSGNDVDASLEDDLTGQLSAMDGEAGVQYVNLLRNPERYTGYTGYTATRIWDAIYHENCFSIPSKKVAPGDDPADSEKCFEKRVFYRLISGLHASISTHLTYHYEDTDAPNAELWYTKVGRYPDRIRNLYFTFAFVTRAVALSLPALKHDFDFSGGPAAGTPKGAHGADRLAAKRITIALDTLSTYPMFSRCNPTFNESLLFRGSDRQQVKRDFVSHFRNISKILDCVACEKCKLWGKLQVLGLGTAIKILLHENEGAPYVLVRNEVIALINLLSKLSDSIASIQKIAKYKPHVTWSRSSEPPPRPKKDTFPKPAWLS